MRTSAACLGMGLAALVCLRMPAAMAATGNETPPPITTAAGPNNGLTAAVANGTFVTAGTNTYTGAVTTTPGFGTPGPVASVPSRLDPNEVALLGAALNFLLIKDPAARAVLATYNYPDLLQLSIIQRGRGGFLGGRFGTAPTTPGVGAAGISTLPPAGFAPTEMDTLNQALGELLATDPAGKRIVAAYPTFTVLGGAPRGAGRGGGPLGGGTARSGAGIPFGGGTGIGVAPTPPPVPVAFGPGSVPMPMSGTGFRGPAAPAPPAVGAAMVPTATEIVLLDTILRKQLAAVGPPIKAVLDKYPRFAILTMGGLASMTNAPGRAAGVPSTAGVAIDHGPKPGDE